MPLIENTDKKQLITMDYLKRKHISLEDTNKLHYHAYHEILVVNKGFITYASNDGIIKILEKSIVFMPAHTLHNPFVQTSHPYERYRIRFYSDFADGILQNEEGVA